MVRNIKALGLLSLFCVYHLQACSDSEKEPAPQPAEEKRANVLIEDFEGEGFRQWTATGDAFGNYPYMVPTKQLQEWGNSGYEGSHMITSFVNGDGGRGTLTSHPFTIERHKLCFLVGGGMQDVYVALVVNGHEVIRSAGLQSRSLSWVTWDVSAYEGLTAQIRLVDNSTAGWGFIDADYFVMADNAISISAKSLMTVTKHYLNLPVSYDADSEKVHVIENGQRVYSFDLRLSNTPDYWVQMDLEPWLGHDIEIEVDCNPLHSSSRQTVQAIRMFYQADEPAEAATLYTEPERPWFHFTTGRAWLSDVCGVYYDRGEWHLQYQRNPYGIDWANMHWGHAVSRDLVHWQELGISQWPDTLGLVFSGTTVIDHDNVLSHQSGDVMTAVSFYTSAGGFSQMSSGKPSTQSMAYSTDGGRHWTKYAGNPVLNEVEPFNRDPHVLWDDAHHQWVMVLFLPGNTYGFYSSKDLTQWTELSRYTMAGEFECPDFYPIEVKETGLMKWILSGVHGNYQVGNWDGKVFVPETAVKDMDFGAMTYVLHSFSNAPNGRRVAIGNTGHIFNRVPFNNQMTFPREVSLHQHAGGDYVLHARPVDEVKLLYKKTESFDVLPASTTVHSPAAHIKACFNIAGNGLLIMQIGSITLQYDTSTNLMSVVNGRETIRQFYAAPTYGKLDIELLSDVGLMELFMSDGAIVGTFYQPYTDTGTTDITVTTQNHLITIDSMTVSEIGNIWND